MLEWGSAPRPPDSAVEVVRPPQASSPIPSMWAQTQVPGAPLSNMLESGPAPRKALQWQGSAVNSSLETPGNGGRPWGALPEGRSVLFLLVLQREKPPALPAPANLTPVLRAGVQHCPARARCPLCCPRGPAWRPWVLHRQGSGGLWTQPQAPCAWCSAPEGPAARSSDLGKAPSLLSHDAPLIRAPPHLAAAAPAALNPPSPERSWGRATLPREAAGAGGARNAEEAAAGVPWGP